MTQTNTNEEVSLQMVAAVLKAQREKQKNSSEAAVDGEKKGHEETKSKLSRNDFVIEDLKSQVHYLKARVEHTDEQMKTMSTDHKEVMDDLRERLQEKKNTNFLNLELKLEQVTNSLEDFKMDKMEIETLRNDVIELHSKNEELQDLLNESEEQRKMLEATIDGDLKRACGALGDAQKLFLKQSEDFGKLNEQCKKKSEEILQKDGLQKSEDLSRQEYQLQMEHNEKQKNKFLKEISDLWRYNKQCEDQMIELERKFEMLKLEKKDLEEENEKIKNEYKSTSDKDADEVIALKESLNLAQERAAEAKQALKNLREEKAIGVEWRKSLAKVEEEKEVLEKEMNEAIAYAKLCADESAQFENMLKKTEDIVSLQEKRIEELEAENSKLKLDLTLSSKDQDNLQVTKKQELLKDESLGCDYHYNAAVLQSYQPLYQTSFYSYPCSNQQYAQQVNETEQIVQKPPVDIYMGNVFENESGRCDRTGWE